MDRLWKIQRWVNLTPHEIVIYAGDKRVAIEPSGNIARVATEHEKLGSATVGEETVDIYSVSYGEVQGLVHVCWNCRLNPQCEAEGRRYDTEMSCSLQEPHTGYLVFSLVLAALREKGIRRSDVFAPDTSPRGAVRDEEGRIIGVRNHLTL